MSLLGQQGILANVVSRIRNRQKILSMQSNTSKKAVYETDVTSYNELISFINSLYNPNNQVFDHAHITIIADEKY